MTAIKAPDAVDAAIAAAGEKAAEIRMAQYQVQISSTGRPAIVALPEDATEGEVAEFAGWMLTILLNTVRQRAAGPRGRIVLPGH